MINAHVFATSRAFCNAGLPLKYYFHAKKLSSGLFSETWQRSSPATGDIILHFSPDEQCSMWQANWSNQCSGSLLCYTRCVSLPWPKQRSQSLISYFGSHLFRCINTRFCSMICCFNDFSLHERHKPLQNIKINFPEQWSDIEFQSVPQHVQTL